jgi:hypothetical protein
MKNFVICILCLSALNQDQQLLSVALAGCIGEGEVHVEDSVVHQLVANVRKT